MKTTIEDVRAVGVDYAFAVLMGELRLIRHKLSLDQLKRMHCLIGEAVAEKDG